MAKKRARKTVTIEMSEADYQVLKKGLAIVERIDFTRSDIVLKRPAARRAKKAR